MQYTWAGTSMAKFLGFFLGAALAGLFMSKLIALPIAGELKVVVVTFWWTLVGDGVPYFSGKWARQIFEKAWQPERKQ